MLLTVWVCASIYYVTDGQHFAPKIIGGESVNITDYPYAAILSVVNPVENYHYWGCTSSIITQQLILTAAHCTPSSDQGTTIIVSVGHNDIEGATRHKALSFLRHYKYVDSVLSAYDIALVKLKVSLTLCSVVSRVALMQKPPYHEKAYVAGWGLVSEIPRIEATVLKAVVQYVRTAKYCRSFDKGMPSDTFCASSNTKRDYPSEGDSGGALVVRGYIQLGLASYAIRNSPVVMFYTDTGYFYEWIIKSANEMTCNDRYRVDKLA